MLSQNTDKLRKTKSRPTLIEIYKVKQEEQKTLKKGSKIIPNDLRLQLLELFKSNTKHVAS